MRPKSDVLCRRVGETAVLVDLTTNQIFELNRTGYRIWELLEEGVDRDGIGPRLQEEFVVEPQMVEQEIEELLTALQAQQLISE